MTTHVHDPLHLEGSHHLGRSVAAVFAGLVAIFVLSMGTDAVLHATGLFPPVGQVMSARLFALALGYRIVWSIFGCYLAARLAPEHPMRHAIILGAIGILLSSAGAAATWDRGPEFGPHWYPLALIAVSLPCAWVGGRLGGRGRQRSRHGA
jgi:hypothetical protein